MAEALELAAALRETPRCLERRLPVLLDAVDRFAQACLSAADAPKVSCAAGCGRCCHQWVEDVAAHEVERLGSLVLARPDPAVMLEALAARIAAYASLEGEATAEERALAYLERGLPCVFLSQAGTCTAYEARPYACRRFFSLSSPELCTAEGIRSGENRSFFLEPHPNFDAALANIDRALGLKAGSGALLADLYAWLGERLSPPGPAGPPDRPGAPVGSRSG